MAKNPRVSATIKVKVKEAIESLAKEDGVTESSMVAELLEKAVLAERRKRAAMVSE